MDQMTLEEKVAQMCQYVAPNHIRDNVSKKGADKSMSGIDAIASDVLSSNDIARKIAAGEVGSCLHAFTVDEVNVLQSLAQRSRLKIPLLIGVDAIHGNGLHSGATIYPTAISIASSFNPELVKKSGRETAVEMRASGMHWAFNPNIEITRDPRWGRTGESFGEDPLLVTRLGVALIKGLQGDNGVEKDKVLACAKHMLGGGIPTGGINAAPAEMSEYSLRELYLPPFEAAVKEAKVFTVMPAHNEVNGIPCHANSYLLQTILRDEYGFDGFTISDWMDIERLVSMHRFAATEDEAFYLSVQAGVDMHMHGPNFLESIVKAVKEGRISEERINKAARKILEAKFLLGLFENPFVDVKKEGNKIFTPEHQQTALEAARQSIVLLKNENNILPLNSKSYKKIFITGPNANSQTILGDWAFLQPEENVVTVYKGIKDICKEAQIDSICFSTNITKMDPLLIDQAAEKAKEADLNIVVVGDNGLRYRSDRTNGENTDRDNLELPGRQQELLEKVYTSGKPTILILLSGRPLSLPWADQNIPAIVEGWESGSKGGQAIAEILFGEVNPSGKLPITFPQNVGQVQTFYNHKASQYSRRFALAKTGPLYSFGYGLSYTTYSYSEPVLAQNTIRKDGKTTVSFDVTNTGQREGTEIVQLYIQDEYASVTRPVKELKNFDRITLKPGETKKVSFDITPKELQFFGTEGKWIVEPGTFKIMVGGSSRDQDLKSTILTVN